MKYKILCMIEDQYPTLYKLMVGLIRPEGRQIEELLRIINMYYMEAFNLYEKALVLAGPGAGVLSRFLQQTIKNNFSVCSCDSTADLDKDLREYIHNNQPLGALHITCTGQEDSEFYKFVTKFTTDGIVIRRPYQQAEYTDTASVVLVFPDTNNINENISKVEQALPRRTYPFAMNPSLPEAELEALLAECKEVIPKIDWA